MSRHSIVNRWIIAADFSQHNGRPYDCFAFTIIPSDEGAIEMERNARQALPKDLKKSKDLDKSAIEWLRDQRRFHIAITLNTDPVVFWNEPGSIPLDVAREYLDATLASAVAANVDTDIIVRLKKIKQDARAKGFNVGLLANIWLLAIWFPLLTVLIAREQKAEVVGWFPDRDNMTNYGGHIWYNLAFWNARLFAETFRVDLSTTQCPAGAPDRSSGKERMWFDYMIRAADWIAGTVAGWDRRRNLVPSDQPKYRRMVEDVIASASNIVVMHLDLDESGMQFRRITATRMNWLMRKINDLRNTWRWLAEFVGKRIER